MKGGIAETELPRFDVTSVGGEQRIAPSRVSQVLVERIIMLCRVLISGYQFDECRAEWGRAHEEKMRRAMRQPRK